jgi:hypothetical protein
MADSPPKWWVDHRGPGRAACRSRRPGAGPQSHERREPPVDIPGTRGSTSPPKRGLEPKDRFLGPADAPIRRSGPPHRPGGPGGRSVGDPAEAGPPPLFRASECRCLAPHPLPGSVFDTLRGSGRLRGLAPLTSPLRRATVSSGPSLVSPMGLVPLRGPFVPVAVPRLQRAEARRFRWKNSVPKYGTLPGQPPFSGHPEKRGSVRSSQRVVRTFRGIPSWLGRSDRLPARAGK